MGNGNSSGRRRRLSEHESGRTIPIKPIRMGKPKLSLHQSLDEGSLPNSSFSMDSGEFVGFPRPRANTYDLASHLSKSISSYEIPTGTSSEGKLPAMLRWKGGGKDVFVSGSFNEWTCKIPMVKSSNDFSLIIDLPQGVHEYRFQVDGVWIHDPSAPAILSNNGSKNNIVEVKESDFEVFEALETDSKKGRAKKEHHESYQSGSPPDSEYCQDPVNRRSYDTSVGPPILPPHLRDIILNQDVPVGYEPNLLPEPTHVSLNHMYALSIKDSVMVLSSTHRFRKKYVTTLLYRPL